jgi:hypothetical protein
MDKNNFHFLFGLPILITSIDPVSYDKENILKIINKNYKKQKTRDKWCTNTFFKTDIHHSNKDEENKSFEKVNYTLLSKCYHKPIEKYLSKITNNKTIKYNFNIVNYTAIKHNSYMRPHLHKECNFSMVHYISFDKKEHFPTIFLNPYFFHELLPEKEKTEQILIEKNTESSWIADEWKHDIEENDLIIFPSVLKHYVRNKDSKKLRVTVAVNISVEINNN